MARDSHQQNDQSWLSREDLQDLAKIGGDLLKRTVSSSLDVLKDVTDSLPKDAQNIISKSREEVLKGLSRDFAKNFVSIAVDRFFSAVREHRLEISIRVRKIDEKNETPVENKNSTSAGHSNDVRAENKNSTSASHSSDVRRESPRHGFKKNPPGRHHP